MLPGVYLNTNDHISLHGKRPHIFPFICQLICTDTQPDDAEPHLYVCGASLLTPSILLHPSQQSVQ